MYKKFNWSYVGICKFMAGGSDFVACGKPWPVCGFIDSFMLQQVLACTCFSMWMSNTTGFKRGCQWVRQDHELNNEWNKTILPVKAWVVFTSSVFNHTFTFLLNFNKLKLPVESLHLLVLVIKMLSSKSMSKGFYIYSNFKCTCAVQTKQQHDRDWAQGYHKTSERNCTDKQPKISCKCQHLK